MTIRGKHGCALGLGSESMLDQKPDTWWGWVCHELHKSMQISEHHPLVFSHFRSYPAILKERKRHVLENKNIIHPFSMFSLVWKCWMILINIAHVMVSTLELCIFIDPYHAHYIDTSDVALAVLDMICLIDMVVQFNMGYVHKKAAIVLNRRQIVRAYCRSYWLPDLLSSIPITMMMLLADFRSSYVHLIPDVLPLIRFVRVVTVLGDLRTLLQVPTNSHIWYRAISHMILFVIAVHCFTCLLYVPSVLVYYVTGDVPVGYTGFLDLRDQKRSFLDVPPSVRYVKGLFVATSAFFSTGFIMYPTTYAGEIVINSVILAFGTMFKMYTIVFALKTYMTVYNSTVRYHELMDQVEKYMHQKQFPAALMRRLREFYSYRFQGSYYREKVALGCLSAQLQSEILLHKYKDLVEKVSVLQDLEPAFLGKLFGHLEPQVYMPNDLIYQVGDDTQYAYFVYTGTVAIYSLRGVEVYIYSSAAKRENFSVILPFLQAYHFEDGDFFGTIELMASEAKRLNTAVAIEITQLYRLNAEDCRNHVLVNTVLYRRFKKETDKRVVLISMIDDLVLMEQERRMGSNTLSLSPSPSSFDLRKHPDFHSSSSSSSS